MPLFWSLYTARTTDLFHGFGTLSSTVSELSVTNTSSQLWSSKLKLPDSEDFQVICGCFLVGKLPDCQSLWQLEHNQEEVDLDLQLMYQEGGGGAVVE